MNTALNYQPEVLVDTADLSREEWLDYRRLGIGGSDAAAIMGLSPFATIRDLYFDKNWCYASNRRRGRKLGSERSGTPPGRFGCHDFCKEDGA